MRSLLLPVLMAMLFGIAGVVHANLDDFNGADLSDIWTYRDPLNNGEYTFEDGKMILDLKAGSDMYIQGVDGGVCFLMDPPDMDSFTLEMQLNIAVNGSQPPACQVGPVLFNEAEWSYSIWGPYNAGQDIRLEDCIGGSYRWRDQAGIAVDVGDVAIDQDVWLKVVKDGNELEFFAKGNADDKWVSGGVDTLLGPKYTPGDYKVGIAAKSWAGSVPSTFEIEYFNIPEIAKAVAPAGKLATTWSAIKK